MAVIHTALVHNKTVANTFAVFFHNRARWLDYNTVQKYCVKVLKLRIKNTNVTDRRQTAKIADLTHLLLLNMSFVCAMTAANLCMVFTYTVTETLFAAKVWVRLQLR